MSRKIPLVFPALGLGLCLALLPLGVTGQQTGQQMVPRLGPSDQDHARAAVARGEILGLTQILQIVSARHPGQVVEVEFEEDDGIHIYEIELLTNDGRLIEVAVDAATGRILEVEDETM